MAKNMVTVNGTWIINPAGVDVVYSVLDRYAERDMNGILHREIAAKKIKYTLSWPYMPDNDEFISMWNLFASLPEFANFTVPNPDGTSHTFQGYIGDMSVTMLSYWDMGQGCQSRWKSFKVSVIER